VSAFGARSEYVIRSQRADGRASYGHPLAWRVTIDNALHLHNGASRPVCNDSSVSVDPAASGGAQGGDRTRVLVYHRPMASPSVPTEPQSFEIPPTRLYKG
jgi:hypothetical protein